MINNTLKKRSRIFLFHDVLIAYEDRDVLIPLSTILTSVRLADLCTRESKRNIGLVKTHTTAVSENAYNTGRRCILIVNPISTHAGWKR